MFRPVFRSLNKIIEETVPCTLNETLEMCILLLIDHLYKKTSLAAPEETRLSYFDHTESKVVYIPTVT
jgi:hypothetical protein